jgi:hypothetical protein
MGYMAGVDGDRRARLRLIVSNEKGRRAADEVQLVVLNAEIPPRVAATRPVKPSTSVAEVGLPLRWVGSSPPSSTISVTPGADRTAELLFFAETPGSGLGPAAVLDLVPEGAQAPLELGAPLPSDDLMGAVPGLRGLEQVPALIRLALRSRDTDEQRFTVALNYDGFWPFGPFLPESMESHVRWKLLDGHLPHSASPYRDPPARPEDPDLGEWSDLGIPPKAYSDAAREAREGGPEAAGSERPGGGGA